MKWSALFATIITVLLVTAMCVQVTWAQIPQNHPRIWLTPEKKAQLVDRLNRHTSSADYLVEWCANHYNDYLSGYISSRATGLLAALNFAVLYQLQGNTAYGQKAVEIIEYAFDHPYGSYTIDTWMEFDNYYNSRYLVSASAIVTDWCWDVMTTAQRDRFIAQLDSWCSNLMSSQPWSWRDPSNNFYYGHTWGLLTSGYAMYGHNANAATYLAEARDVMLPEAIHYTRGEQIPWPQWDNTTGRANGGMWNEGTSYGCVNTELLCAAILAVRAAEDPDFASDFTFANEWILFNIYSMYPTYTRGYSDGDGASTGGLDATDRIPMICATELADGRTKQYGQYWINHWTNEAHWAYKIYNEFVWYDDQLVEVDYRRELGTQYYLEGVQTLFWRSDWTENSCWLMMKLGLSNTGHGHNGIGHFIIYRDGYLIADKAALTQQSMLYSDVEHNTLFIQPGDDKKFYWGHSDLEHLENTADYLYLAGDLTGPYTAQPDYRNNTVEHREREFFFIKADQAMVIMDRGKTFSSSIDKVFQVYMENAPTASGTGYRVTNGSWDLVLHPAWPPSAVASAGSNGIPIVRVTTPASETEKTFINVMKVLPRGASLQTAPVTVSNPAFAGAAFQSGGGVLDYVTVFSDDIEGDTPSFSSFTMTYNYYSTAVRVFVMNLTPSTTYYYGNNESAGTITISVSTSSSGSSGSAVSSDEGVLSFIVYPGEEPQPLVIPSGVKID